MASLERDHDDISLDDEFLRHSSPSSGDVPSTAETNKKARDPKDVDTPPSVASDYYDVNDPLCPQPSAPPLEMLVEDDGQFDEAYAISRSQQMSNRPPLSVVANPPLPTSRGAAGKGGGMAGGTAGGVGLGTVNELEGRDRQGWMLVPPPPTTTATSAVYDPRAGSGTVPFARAKILGNVPVCEVMPIPSPALAQAQAQYNDEEGGGVRDSGGNSGMNDVLPIRSIKCQKFVKIGLMLLGLVVASVIITVVVMKVEFNENDTVPVDVTIPPVSSPTNPPTSLPTSNPAASSHNNPAASSPNNPPVPSPTNSPVSSPTNSPVASGCTDTPDWVDSYGDGCEWYEANDSPGCPEFGTFIGIFINKDRGIAKDNCCYCMTS